MHADKVHTSVRTITLPKVHRTLIGALNEIIIPRCAMPGGWAAAASAIYQTKQMCIWWNGDVLNPTKLPQITLETIEHECAHLLCPTRGAPDEGAWDDAIERDWPLRPGHPRFVDPADRECPAQRLVEDWAYSVQYLREHDLAGWLQFRKSHPHRAEIIDQVLGAP